MDSSLKLFLIGFAIGLMTTIILDRSEGNPTFMHSFVTGAFSLWQLIFMIIMVTTVPFLAVEPLKKRFTRKNFLPFPFLAGNGTAFILAAIAGKIISILN
jgi:hypothetical protein